MPPKHYCRSCNTMGTHTTINCPKNRRKTNTADPKRGGKGKGNRKRWDDGERKLECIICGKNHTAWDCPERHDCEDVDADGNIVRDEICFNCGQRGHRSWDCTKITGRKRNLQRVLTNLSRWRKARDEGLIFEDIMLLPPKSERPTTPHERQDRNSHDGGDEETPERHHILVQTHERYKWTPAHIEYIVDQLNTDTEPDIEVQGSELLLVFHNGEDAKTAMWNGEGLIDADGDAMTLKRTSAPTHTDVDQPRSEGATRTKEKNKEKEKEKAEPAPKKTTNVATREHTKNPTMGPPEPIPATTTRATKELQGRVDTLSGRVTNLESTTKSIQKSVGTFKLQYNAHQAFNAKCFEQLLKQQSLAVPEAPPDVTLDESEAALIHGTQEDPEDREPTPDEGDTHMRAQVLEKRTASEAAKTLRGDTGAEVQTKWANVRGASRKLEAHLVRVDLSSRKDVNGVAVLCTEDTDTKIIRWVPEGDLYESKDQAHEAIGPKRNKPDPPAASAGQQ